MNTESKGRVRKQYGGHSWASRDYTGDIKCHVDYCPCNNKNGMCELPSNVDIRPDGKCQKSIDFMPPAFDRKAVFEEVDKSTKRMAKYTKQQRKELSDNIFTKCVNIHEPIDNNEK